MCVCMYISEYMCIYMLLLYPFCIYITALVSSRRFRSIIHGKNRSASQQHTLGPVLDVFILLTRQHVQTRSPTVEKALSREWPHVPS